MDKRAFLNTLVGKRSASKSNSTQQFSKTQMNLNPYTGPWDFSNAKHLLARTTFGPTKASINQAVQDGLDATIDKLLEDVAPASPPIYFNTFGDLLVPNGQTWVNTVSPGFNGQRRTSLKAWATGLMYQSKVSIHEKMILFWHDHLPISDIGNPLYSYRYWEILRSRALGNFRDMMEEITINPAMLLYLNGHENTEQSPNENYARELMELFTVGRGDFAGPGDYTNYTEQDVEELARALTGWRVVANAVTQQIGSIYVNNRHDKGDKQLSNRLGNVVITNEGDQEYKTVVDIMLQQDATALYIMRQLHVWLIGSDISPDVEDNIIIPLADIYRNNNYEMKPVLNALLGSEYFFDLSHRGCMVTHPLDFTFKIFNTFEMAMPNGFIDQYRFWSSIYNFNEVMEMALFELPSVAGWKAFYQTPQYYNYWINTVSLGYRELLTNVALAGFDIGDVRAEIDVFKLLASLDDPMDPNNMLKEISTLIFVTEISQDQLEFLKEALLSGLPDYEWTVEYSDYLVNPDDQGLADAVRNKMLTVLNIMMKMPEFYLI